MTVAANVPLVNIAATAGQTVFPFGFRTDFSSLISVWVDDVSRGTFTVTLNGDQSGSPGGTVTLPAGLNAGQIVSIERDTPESQETAFITYGQFAATAVELEFDDLVMMIQELSALCGRAVVLSRANSVDTSSTMPAPVIGAVLGWVQNGTGVELGNIQPTGIALTGTVLRRNQALGGTQDGAHSTFTLPYLPIDGTSFDIYLGGLRVPQTSYTSSNVAGTWTVVFGAGNYPQSGQAFTVDIYSSS